MFDGYVLRKVFEIFRQEQEKYLDTKKVLPKYGFQHKNERFYNS